MTQAHKETGGSAARGYGPAAILTADRAADLIQAIAERQDRVAFSELYRYFLPRLKSFVARGGADPETAQEVAQEAMISVWRKSATFDRERASVSSWIFTIARNKRIDALRRVSRPTIEVDDWLNAFTVEEKGPDGSLSATQLHTRMQLLVQRLPVEQRIILQKAFVEEKTHSAIAEELQLPLGTVKSRIRLAVLRLRAAMELEETP